MALHEKVTRSRVDHGYAYVKTETSGVVGWVDNAQLLWRLPDATRSATPAAAEATKGERPAPDAAKPPDASEAAATGSAPAAASSPAVAPGPPEPPPPADRPSPRPPPSTFDPY